MILLDLHSQMERNAIFQAILTTLHLVSIVGSHTLVDERWVLRLRAHFSMSDAKQCLFGKRVFGSCHLPMGGIGKAHLFKVDVDSFQLILLLYYIRSPTTRCQIESRCI